VSLRRAKLVIAWMIGFVVLAYAVVVGVVWYKQEELIYPAPRGPGGSVAGYQAVAYETSDGLRLTGGYRAAQPGMPTLLFFHGNASDWQSTAWILEPLARDGYGVFAASYRGYRSNPGRPSEAGIYRDARAAVAWLAARGIGSGDLVIVGNSLGSGPAVELARTIHPRGLALVSPFASLRQLAAAHFRWLPVELLMRDRYDNAAKLPGVAAPVLIMHGDRDTVIPLAQAQQLRRRARNVTFVVVPGAGHELVALDDTPRTLREWLRRLPAS
jgi:hypothetical protein